MQAERPLRLVEAMPPVALDEEESLCACLIGNPEILPLIVGKLLPEHFYSQQYRTIYKACLKLWSVGQPTEVNRIIRVLVDEGNLDAAGGQSYLISLFANRFEPVHALEYYAGVISEKHQRRQYIKAAQAVIDIAQKHPEWAEGRSQIEKLFFDIGQDIPRKEIRSFADLAPEAFEAVQSRVEGKASDGLQTGFYDLDAMTQGFCRQDLIIIAGRPSMGKSAIAANITRNILQTHQEPVLIYSMEMSAQSLYQRFLASEAGILGQQLRAGRIDDWSKISEGIAVLSQLPGYIDDSAVLTLADIRSKSMLKRAEHGKLGAIVIDYLQLMGSDSGGADRVRELGRITSGLKQLAREMDCPVVCLSQLSRGVESRTDKRPMMSDLRESGNIEQDADLILMLYRDEYYNPDTQERGIAEVIVAKQRNGPRGTVKLLFDGERTQFMNLKRYE